MRAVPEEKGTALFLCAFRGAVFPLFHFSRTLVLFMKKTFFILGYA